MEIPVFLAMTAAEALRTDTLPEHPAWMACHFSAYGQGLSNLPEVLPKGAMLMLNDRIPLCGHDPSLVADTLCDTASRLACGCIALDFRREPGEAVNTIIDSVLAQAPCPVGVSDGYARDHDCPVLLRPVEPYTIPQEAFFPWKGRELWLELTLQGVCITVTSEGSHYESEPFYLPSENAHTDPQLHCHYEIQTREDQICFRLARTAEDLRMLLKEGTHYGVSRGLALYQELDGL